MYWTLGLLAALGLFVSILLHEVGHAFVAKRFGITVRGIRLFVFGGVAELGSDRITRVEVHLSDESSRAKSRDNDKRCVVEARPAGLTVTEDEEISVVVNKITSSACDLVAVAFQGERHRGCAIEPGERPFLNWGGDHHGT